MSDPKNFTVEILERVIPIQEKALADYEALKSTRRSVNVDLDARIREFRITIQLERELIEALKEVERLRGELGRKR